MLVVGAEWSNMGIHCPRATDYTSMNYAVQWML